jgi:hypothetical protein
MEIELYSEKENTEGMKFYEIKRPERLS